MADRAESEDETSQLRKVALETATSILQIRQRAEQEIRRANEILQSAHERACPGARDYARHSGFDH